MKSKRSSASRVNNNTLAILALILIVINAIIFAMQSKDLFTGKATEQAYVRLCIGVPPSIYNLGDGLPKVLSGIVNVNASTNNTYRVDFYYYRYGSFRSPLGSDNDSDNDTIFSYMWNTTQFPDGNCNYVIDAEATDVCGLKATDITDEYSVDNVFVEPIWDEFKNNLSTNFTAAGPPYSYILNANVTILDWGTVYFIGTTNFDDVNLDTMINISNNTISIYPSNWCFRYQYYTLEFRNISYADPMVLKNGNICGAGCFNYEIGNGTIKFISYVDADTNFTLTEGTNITLDLTLNPSGQDVDLNWSYVLNNPYSTPPDSYNIYYSDNATQMLNLSSFGSPNVSGITDLHWTDTTANQSSQRYYVVTAEKNGHEARAPQTGCKYDVPVYAGQNLVSLPCATDQIEIDRNVVPPATSMYDRITRYVPGLGFQRTDYYGPVWKWWGYYDYLEPDKGYYLYPTKADFVIVSVGTVPIDNRTVNVSSGLNFLGWTSVFSKNINDVLNPGEDHWYNAITRYNATTGWERVDYYGTTWLWWGYFDKFDPTRGYWYYPVAQNYTWEYNPI